MALFDSRFFSSFERASSYYSRMNLSRRETTQSKQSDLHQLCLQRLNEIARVDSQTNNIAGVNRLQNILKKKFSSLGFKCRLISNQFAQSGEFLLAERTLDCANDSAGVSIQSRSNIPRPSVSRPNVFLVGHVDTVWGLADGGRIETDNETFKGPGVLDMKAGVVTLWTLAEQLIREEVPINLYILLSPNEEKGSPGFTQLYQSWADKADIVLGFEPGDGHGHFISSRKGNRWYDFIGEGISAHSGRSCRDHLNIAHEIMQKYQACWEQTRAFDDSSFHITSIEGGQGRSNVVCDKVILKVDMRFKYRSTRDQIHSAVSEVFQEQRYVIDIKDDCPPLENSVGQSQNWIGHLGEILSQEFNLPCNPIHSGGASDVNYLSTGRNIVLCGLGGIGEGMHQRQEKVEIFSIVKRVKALTRFFKARYVS